MCFFEKSRYFLTYPCIYTHTHIYQYVTYVGIHYVLTYVYLHAHAYMHPYMLT